MTYVYTQDTPKQGQSRDGKLEKGGIIVSREKQEKMLRQITDTTTLFTQDSVNLQGLGLCTHNTLQLSLPSSEDSAILSVPAKSVV